MADRSDSDLVAGWKQAFSFGKYKQLCEGERYQLRGPLLGKAADVATGAVSLSPSGSVNEALARPRSGIVTLVKKSRVRGMTQVQSEDGKPLMVNWWHLHPLNARAS